MLLGGLAARAPGKHLRQPFEQLRETLACPRFVDRSPAEIVATLLDEGQYLCSERTIYRILAEDHRNLSSIHVKRVPTGAGPGDTADRG